MSGVFLAAASAVASSKAKQVIGLGAANVDGTTPGVTQGAKGAFLVLADAASLAGKRTYQTAAAFTNAVAAPITNTANMAANALAQQSDMSRAMAGIGGSLFEGLSKLFSAGGGKGSDKQQMAQKAGAGGCPDGNCGKASVEETWKSSCPNGNCGVS